MSVYVHKGYEQHMWRITAKGTLNRLPLVSDLQTLEASQ